MKNAWLKAKKAIAGFKVYVSTQTMVTLNEVHAYLGVILIGYGLNVMLPGAGWATAGAIILWFGVRR